MGRKQSQDQDQQRQRQGQDEPGDVKPEETFPEATEGQDEDVRRPRDPGQSDSSRNEGKRDRGGQGNQSRG